MKRSNSINMSTEISDMKLCVLIPAYNEEQNLRKTIGEIYRALKEHKIAHTILVINDHSTDNTAEVLAQLSAEITSLKPINNGAKPGFGNAIQYGLKVWEGDAVVIAMADGSEDATDVVLYYKLLLSSEVDCVFGSRFIVGGTIKGYPKIKLALNRIFNSLVALCADSTYNDYTNAFKAYKRKIIEGCVPFSSSGFSLTLELPLKAIEMGCRYTVVPISWSQREKGNSNLNVLRNSSSYFRILRQYLLKQL